jgi:hypothetical protein
MLRRRRPAYLTIHSAADAFSDCPAKRCGRRAERHFPDLMRLNKPVKKEYCAAMEQPDLFVSHVRATFQALAHIGAPMRQMS